MKFKLIGDVSATTHFGYDFAAGPQDVKEPEFIEKMKSHPNFEQVSSAHPVEVPIERLSKEALEKLGRAHGVEVDRRRKRDTIIEQVREAMNADND
jgi:hypothetical protein